MQRAGLRLRALALAEQVDDALAAVGGHVVRVAEGFGDLLAGINTFEREDFTQVRGRVQPSFVQAVVEGFGIGAELQEALQGLVGAGFMTGREHFDSYICALQETLRFAPESPRDLLRSIDTFAGFCDRVDEAKEIIFLHFLLVELLMIIAYWIWNKSVKWAQNGYLAGSLLAIREPDLLPNGNRKVG